MPLILRPYQEEAVGRFVERIDHVPRGGLIVLPTGTGKSLVMAEIAAWWLANRKGGVGIVSHRKELVRQNADEYDEIVGREGACIKEQGSDYRAELEDWERVRAGGVISFTVQTLQNRRLMKVSRDAIGLLLIDECHRIKEQGQYDKVREYFGCKWVGLTATPDRTDGQKLVGPMFDECWYGHQKGQLLNDFIEQGWLTPPRIRHIHVASLEWKWLKGRSGKDFTNDQVGKVWQDFKSIHQFVAPIIKEVGLRKTLYFCPKVQQAKAVADVINSTSHPRRIADYVASYKIDEDGNRSDYCKHTRRRLIKRMGVIADELQHLANMGVFVEGTNIPIISAIGWLRFTKSRLLLTQGVGRALRAWPGILNGLERATAALRRAAIAASPKPVALIFDPTKRAGTKLSLAHMIDVLQPNLSAEVRERAISLIGQKGKHSGEYDPREIIEEARHLETPFFKGLRAALMEISPDIQYKLHDIDPFTGNPKASWEMAPKEQAKNIGDASDKQKGLIRKLAPAEYSDEFYQSLGRKQAGSIIDKLMKNPPVGWILKRLRNMMIDKIPETNKQGLDLLRQGRQA